MNNSIHNAADGEQCAVCGGRIEEDGHEITEGEETIAYVHTNCA